MKALAFQAGEMDHHNGTVWAGQSLKQLCDGEGWQFEGRKVVAIGIIGPQYVRDGLKELLERHRTLDSALLQRMATYEVEETHWAALIAVEGLDGIHYLRRMPGVASSLIYYPLLDKQAIVITHRSAKPKFLEKNKSRNVLSAIHCCTRKHS